MLPVTTTSPGTPVAPAGSGFHRTGTARTGVRIYATPIPTDRRIHTLMHDPQYRVAIAWQNTAYNQPPHPSFFLGNGMSAPPRPHIHVR